jgi:GAF domain-containing protein
MAVDVSLHDVRHALVELGRLRFGEMRVEDAIREIVHTTHSMFHVDGAGLMLADADQHLRNVAASDARFTHLEELQIEHQEGPCIEAFDSKQLVGVDDLANDHRWPLFSDAAVARRVRAVLASPIPYNQYAVGVVAVLSEESRPWSPEGELALLTGALNSRQVIEQAKGVLIGTKGISARAAYEQLRAQARAERRKLAAVCADVVENASRPAARPSAG